MFRFIDVPPGDYILSIAREGYAPLNQGGLRVSASELVTRRAEAAADRRPRRDGKDDRARTANAVRQRRPAAGPIRTRRRRRCRRARRCSCRCPTAGTCRCPSGIATAIGGDYPYVERQLVGSLQPEQAQGGLSRLRQADVLRVHGRQRLAARGTQPAGAERRQHASARAASGSSAAAASTCRSRRCATSFDLFRGDTAFRPVDWRVRVAPAFSVNFVNLSEYNGVNADVRRKDTRLDHHLGIQEAFVEKKLFDISLDYDFISVRAGIQEFTLRLPRLHGGARGARRARVRHAEVEPHRVQRRRLRPAREGHQQRLQRAAPAPRSRSTSPTSTSRISWRPATRSRSASTPTATTASCTTTGTASSCGRRRSA